MGFEPTISSVTGWRFKPTKLRSHINAANLGKSSLSVRRHYMGGPMYITLEQQTRLELANIQFGKLALYHLNYYCIYKTLFLDRRGNSEIPINCLLYEYIISYFLIKVKFFTINFILIKRNTIINNLHNAKHC